MSEVGQIRAGMNCIRPYRPPLALGPLHRCQSGRRRGLDDLRLVADREVDRVGDKAVRVRLFVKRAGLVQVAAGRDSHPRAQDHLGKSAACGFRKPRFRRFS